MVDRNNWDSYSRKYHGVIIRAIGNISFNSLFRLLCACSNKIRMPFVSIIALENEVVNSLILVCILYVWEIWQRIFPNTKNLKGNILKFKPNPYIY